MSVRVASEEADETRPLIPDIAGLTTAVDRELPATGEVRNAFTSITKKLQDAARLHGRRPPTVETILNHVRLLAELTQTGPVESLTSDHLRQLDEQICGQIRAVVSARLPSEDTPYHALARWLGNAHRDHPVEVFTTNYDLLMEQALEDLRRPYFDGFIGAHQAFFDRYAIEQEGLPARWARLWKIHGSINWREDSNGHVYRGGDGDDTRACIIYPSLLKHDETRRMPYLALVDRLRAYIQQPSAVLVVCGYSFGDSHLNDVITHALQSNPSAVAFALLYSGLDDYPDAHTAASMAGNLCLLARDDAVIGRQRGAWELPSDTEPLAPFASSDGGGAVRFLPGDFARLGEFLGGLSRRGSEARRGADV